MGELAWINIVCNFVMSGCIVEDKEDCVGDGGRSVVECGDGEVCMVVEHGTSMR